MLNKLLYKIYLESVNLRWVAIIHLIDIARSYLLISNRNLTLSNAE